MEAMGTAVSPAGSASARSFLHVSAFWAAAWADCEWGSRLLAPAGAAARAAAWRSALTGCRPAGAEGKWRGISRVGHLQRQLVLGTGAEPGLAPPPSVKAVARLQSGRRHGQATAAARLRSGGVPHAHTALQTWCVHACTPDGLQLLPSRPACCLQAALWLHPLHAQQQSPLSHLHQLHQHAASGTPPSGRRAGGWLPELPGGEGSGCRRHGRLLRRLHAQAGHLQGRSRGT